MISSPLSAQRLPPGETICDEDSPIILETMNFPEPVISMAIEPKTKADQEKLGLALEQPLRRRPDVQGPLQ